MKNRVKTFGLWLPLFLMAGILVYAGLAGRPPATRDAGRSVPSGGPPRLVENGPYVRDLVMSWSEGGVEVALRASRLCFVKSRLMGMDNALMKKMRLDGVVVEVRRGDQKLLRMTQARVVGAPSGKRFVLKSPTVVYPDGTLQPDKAVIHKDRREIVFWYGEERRCLDFSGAGPFTLPPAGRG